MQPTIFFKNLKLDDEALYGLHRYPYGVAYWSADRWWYSGINVIGPVLPIPIDSQEVGEIKAWLIGQFGEQELRESDFRPGTAYARIAWPLSTSCRPNGVIDIRAMTQASVALKLLVTKMESIFETVEPVPANSLTYGHRIRELLLLASMEVEASWAAVLKANGYAGSRLTTNDYVKLLGPMMLDSYSVTLRSYPEFPIATPFKGWDPQGPTKSLAWYDAYNQTKHNREECLNVATLELAISAVQAAGVMYWAQFGHDYGIIGEGHVVLGVDFTFETDFSSYPTACYIPNAQESTKAGEWEMLDYPFPPA